MENKKLHLTDTDAVMIGTWLAGNELQHLKALTPHDFKGDARDLVAKIKDAYYAGISRGYTVSQMQQIQLIDKLRKAGYTDTDMYNLIDDAAPQGTAYIQAVARLYEIKSRAMLDDIDYSKPGAQEQAQAILDTYTLDGIQALKVPDTTVVEDILAQIDSPDDVVSYNIGIPMLTRMAGGLRPQDLTAIGARPSVGKSAFCLQVALDNARAGYTVILAVLEMSSKAIVRRAIVATAAGGATMDMVNGGVHVPEDARKAIGQAAKEVDNLIQSGRLIILEGESELAALEQQVELYRPDILIIDQLTQLQDSRQKFDNIRLEYKHLTKALKDMAMDTGISIVLAAQLSRKADELPREAHPTNDMFKESGSIEEDADRCIILHDIDRDDADAEGPRVDLWVTKNRDYLANFCVHAKYSKRSQRFIPLDPYADIFIKKEETKENEDTDEDHEKF